MSKFIVEGGRKLKGDIQPQGAKNEALQVICATLLTDDEVIIRNIPDISDVNRLIELISSLGAEVKKLSADTYSFKATNIDLDYLESPG
jgi:UDP-N-acetylglucosamine 1-carboxyvinyltransferase